MQKRVTLKELKQIARQSVGCIDKIYLHWTAGRYHQFYDDYHINIDDDGAIIITCDNLTELKAHTWRRNTNAVGIALCCCYNAHANSGYDTDFGEYPPTKAQIETAAKVVAALCDCLGLAVTRSNVMTHCEAAMEDDYGPFSGDPETRWDLWYLPDYDGDMKPGGDVIRGKAIWWQNNEV